MTQTLHGTIRGNTIVLSGNPGLAEGQAVEVVVRAVAAGAATAPGQGLLRSEGALSDDPHWDGIMEAVHRERKRERGPAQDDR